jgi:hypothetical protein
MRANKKIPRKNLKEIKICINQIKRIKSGVGQEKGGKKLTAECKETNSLF